MGFVPQRLRRARSQIWPRMERDKKVSEFDVLCVLPSSGRVPRGHLVCGTLITPNRTSSVMPHIPSCVA